MSLTSLPTPGLHTLRTLDQIISGYESYTVTLWLTHAVSPLGLVVFWLAYLNLFSI